MSSADWPQDSVPSSRFPVYTRLNATDVLPDPITPLGASLLWDGAILPGWALGDAHLRAFRLDEVKAEAAPPPAAFFYGHLYIDQSFTRVFGVRAGIGVDGVDVTYFGAHPDAPPHVPSAADDDPDAGPALAEFTGWVLGTEEYPEVDQLAGLADLFRAQRPDLAVMSDWALVARARSAMPLEHLAWGSHNKATKGSGVGPAVLGAVLSQIAPAQILTLIGAAGDVDSAVPSYALWELSREVRADDKLAAAFDGRDDGLLDRLQFEFADFAQRFERFLARFGYRGPNEWDLGSPSWETHPDLALALVDRLRFTADDDSPAARCGLREKEGDAALEQVLASLDDEAARGTVLAAVASSRRFAAWRERTKRSAVMLIHEARVALLELGRRLVAGGVISDAELVFFAVEDELDALIVAPSSIAGVLAARRQGWLALFDVELPMFLEGDKPLPALADLPRRSQDAGVAVTTGEVLVGTPCSSGVVRGRARVVPDTAHIDEFQPGEILIAPQTDPSWTPLFMVATGVVVDVGSMVSHAMIVSRELGVPCVAGVGGATRRIRTGALVEVDGATGTVTVLEA